MEDAVKNQRAIIFFLWKEGSSGSNITQRLKDVFGELAFNETTVGFNDSTQVVKIRRVIRDVGGGQRK